MTKFETSLKLIALVGAGAFISVGCGSSSSTPTGTPGTGGSGMMGTGGTGGGISLGGGHDGGAGTGGNGGTGGGIVIGGSGGGGTGGSGTGGSGTGGAAGTGGGMVTIPANVAVQDYPVLKAQLDCSKLFGCCSAIEIAAISRTTTFTMQACVAALSQDAAAEVMGIQDSMTAGRIVYHGDKAAGCLMAEAAQSCDAARAGMKFNDPMGNCVGLLEPKVAVSGACLATEECIGSWCGGPQGATMGTCMAKLADGAACDDGGECTSGGCDAANMTCGAPGPTIGLCSTM